MIRREALAREAVMAAARFRLHHKYPADEAIDPFDLAHREGLDVRMEALKSLEGMYAPDQRTIVLGSLRPRGRRSYSCAHELGHHVFGHGLCVDQMLDEGTQSGETDDREFVAERFAAALLMPKLAVLSAFTKRKWPVATATPAQIYIVAGVLGVGYTTLIGYLEGTLHAVGYAVAQGLRKVTPKVIRRGMLGEDPKNGLVVVDELWTVRPVDVEIGDSVLVPSGTLCDGEFIQRSASNLLVVRSSGTGWLRRAGRKIELRAAAAGYTGLAQYRFLEADND